MQNNHAKAIKGMSIANIVLSGVSILASLVMIGFNSAIAQFILDKMPRHNGYAYYDLYDGSTIAQMMSVLMYVVFGLLIAGAAIVLVAGIIGLCNWNKPEKLGLVFRWSIAGAVLGIICAGFVQAVLCIITAVFASGDKKLYQSGTYYGSTPGAAYAGQSGAQPVAPVQTAPSEAAADEDATTTL